MRLLLDTHTFFWYITNDPRLPRFAIDAIRDKSNEAFLSVVSVWEALVKHQIGKLPLPTNTSTIVGGPIELQISCWMLMRCHGFFRSRCITAILSIAC